MLELPQLLPWRLVRVGLAGTETLLVACVYGLTKQVCVTLIGVVPLTSAVYAKAVAVIAII